MTPDEALHAVGYLEGALRLLRPTYPNVEAAAQDYLRSLASAVGTEPLPDPNPQETTR